MTITLRGCRRSSERRLLRLFDGSTPNGFCRKCDAVSLRDLTAVAEAAAADRLGERGVPDPLRPGVRAGFVLLPRFVDPRFNRSSGNSTTTKTTDKHNNINNGGPNNDGGCDKSNEGTDEHIGNGRDQETQHLSSSSSPSTSNNKKKRHLVARPFGTMRGHTAFLTFATRSNLPPSSLPP